MKRIYHYIGRSALTQIRNIDMSTPVGVEADLKLLLVLCFFVALSGPYAAVGLRSPAMEQEDRTAQSV